MNRRDWELLDRQMSRLHPAPPARGLNALVGCPVRHSGPGLRCRRMGHGVGRSTH
jgi:hypothetical protein